MATRHTSVTCTCADPRSTKLAGHAASAALYVTDPERKHAGRDLPELEQQSQPSFPPPGLTLASASAAASLAHANQKTLEPWKPEKQPHAEKAALLAKGYQGADPPSIHTISPEVYKAALLAAQERVMTSPPPMLSPYHGYDQSAAEQVMMAGGRRAPSPTPVKANIGALTAATGAISNRRRAESAPIKPVLIPEASYALSAAAISHQASLGVEAVSNDSDPSIEAARILNIAKTNVQLYTATPPVDIEVAEQKQRDTLRAAAISMAKNMYAAAAAKEDTDMAGPASSAAQYRHSRRLSQSQYSWMEGDENEAIRQPTNLHEAAQKIAAEKLAKMHQNDLAHQQRYYGTGPSARSRLTIARRLRRRTSSDSDASRVDWERSVEIRNQMSSLQSRLHDIDEKKHQDRAELLEIARRNVDAAIHDMDEQIYAKTGKPSPNMQREWEEKAQERAKAESEARISTFGKISLGGQKYMNEVDVEAIARARIQPTLDEITDRVEEQKAREVEQRLDQERKQRTLEIQRQRELETKMEEKRQKAVQQTETDNRYSDKDRQGLWDRTSKVFRGRKQAERPDYEKGRDEGNATEPHTVPIIADVERNRDDGDTHRHDHVTRGFTSSRSQRPFPPRSSTDEHIQTATSPHHAGDVAVASGAVEPDRAPATTLEASSTPTSPKGESKLKTWFKTRVGRRASKPPPPEQIPRENPQENEAQESTSGFTGGAVLTGATVDNPRGAPLSSNPVTERDLAPSSSTRSDPEGTMEAVRQWSTSTTGSAAGSKKSSVPSEYNGKRRRLRTSLKDMISRKSTSEAGSAPVSPLASPTNPSATRNVGTAALTRPSATRSNTMERDELRDSFTEEALPPPPTLNTVVGRGSLSSARDSRFSENL